MQAGPEYGRIAVVPKDSGRQTSLGYLLIYFWAILILAAIIIVFHLVVFPSGSQQAGCTFAAGIYCQDIVLSSNSIASSAAVLLKNTQIYPILNPQVTFSANNVSATGSCSPDIVQPGGTMVCNATFLHKSFTLGAPISGTVSISAVPCQSLNVANCQGGKSQTTSGTFSIQISTISQGPLATISLTVANTTQAADGAQDSVTATVELLGTPLPQATVTFIESNTFAILSPKVVLTGGDGSAIAYISSLLTGETTVTATFENVSATANILFISPISMTVEFGPGLSSICSGTNSGQTILKVGSKSYTCSQLPVVLLYKAGSIYNYSFASQVPNVPDGSGVQYAYLSATGCGLNGEAGRFTVPNSNCTIALNYTKQYYLSETVNPHAGGTVLPGSGWEKAGAPVTLSAISNPGWAFTGWAGIGISNYSGSVGTFTIAINGPLTQQANFISNSIAVTTTMNFTVCNGLTSDLGCLSTDNCTVAGGTACVSGYGCSTSTCCCFLSTTSTTTSSTSTSSTSTSTTSTSTSSTAIYCSQLPYNFGCQSSLADCQSVAGPGGTCNSYPYDCDTCCCVLTTSTSTSTTSTSSTSTIQSISCSNSAGTWTCSGASPSCGTSACGSCVGGTASGASCTASCSNSAGTWTCTGSNPTCGSACGACNGGSFVSGTCGTACSVPYSSNPNDYGTWACLGSSPTCGTTCGACATGTASGTECATSCSISASSNPNDYGTWSCQGASPTCDAATCGVCDDNSVQPNTPAPACTVACAVSQTSNPDDYGTWTCTGADSGESTTCGNCGVCNSGSAQGADCQVTASCSGGGGTWSCGGSNPSCGSTCGSCESGSASSVSCPTTVSCSYSGGSGSWSCAGLNAQCNNAVCDGCTSGSPSTTASCTTGTCSYTAGGSGSTGTWTCNGPYQTSPQCNPNVCDACTSGTSSSSASCSTGTCSATTNGCSPCNWVCSGDGGSSPTCNTAACYDCSGSGATASNEVCNVPTVQVVQTLDNTPVSSQTDSVTLNYPEAVTAGDTLVIVATGVYIYGYSKSFSCSQDSFSAADGRGNGLTLQTSNCESYADNNCNAPGCPRATSSYIWTGTVTNGGSDSVTVTSSPSQYLLVGIFEISDTASGTPVSSSTGGGSGAGQRPGSAYTVSPAISYNNGAFAVAGLAENVGASISLSDGYQGGSSALGSSGDSGVGYEYSTSLGTGSVSLPFGSSGITSVDVWSESGVVIT